MLPNSLFSIPRSSLSKCTKIVLFYSDEYDNLYPYAPDSANNANFFVYTKAEIEKMNIVTDIVSLHVTDNENIFDFS